MVEQVEPLVSESRERVLCRIWEVFSQGNDSEGMNTVFDNKTGRHPRNPGPTTPVKRGRGRNLKPHPDISVESPYFSPSKERSPRPENFLIVERRLQPTTTKTDQTVTAYTDRSLDNYASESDDPFEATQTRIPAAPTSVSGLYRQLALCKPYLIQGVLFLS